MKKRMALAWVAVVLLLCGCAGQTSAPGQSTAAETFDDLPHVTTVGFSMPEASDKYEAEVAVIQEKLEAQGFAVAVEYAALDPAVQSEQIQHLLSLGVDCLVVMPVDPPVLAGVMQQATVPVVSYDRVLPGAAVHIGFDSYAAGEKAGQKIAENKELASAQTQQRGHTVEFFMGSPEDSNALLFYQGVMAVLQPYLDNGVLKALSGRVSFEDTCTPGCSAQEAKEDCRKYLEWYYTDQPLEVCVTGWDSLAGGCVQALEGQDPLPVITGAGAESDALERIELGRQIITFRYDRRALSGKCAEAVLALLAGQQVQTTTEIFGVKAYLLSPETVEAT